MVGQVWRTPTEGLEMGGYWYSDRLSHDLRMALQPSVKFRQFTDIKDEIHQGCHRGETVHWNIHGNLETQGDYILETNTVPETDFQTQQGTMTISEAANSVPFTSKLDDLSYAPARQIVTKTLRYDAQKFLDNSCAAQWNRTPLRVAPQGGASTTALSVEENGVSTVTNASPLRSDHVRLMVEEMKERDIPPFQSDDYFAIGRVRSFSALKADLEDKKQYTGEGWSSIMRGEIGRYEGCRFIEQTHKKKGSLGTTAGTPWGGGSDWVFFFGDDCVAEGLAIPEEIRAKIPDDYGRGRGIAWYFLGGHGIVHTDPTQARILMWDSAA